MSHKSFRAVKSPISMGKFVRKLELKSLQSVVRFVNLCCILALKQVTNQLNASYRSVNATSWPISAGTLVNLLKLKSLRNMML